MLLGSLNRIYFLLFILVLTSVPLKAQDIILRGRVFSQDSTPLYQSFINQVNTPNRTITGPEGDFELELNWQEDIVIIANAWGYLDNFAWIKLAEEDTCYIEIYLNRDTTLSYIQQPYEASHFHFSGRLLVDISNFDYGNYTMLLGNENISILNNSASRFPYFEFAFYNRNFSLAAGIGFGGTSSPVELDSVSLIVNTTQAGLNLGYYIIDSKRIVFAPFFSIRLLKERLVNYASEDLLPVEKYLKDPFLDIRFNQVTGTLGLNLEYKIYEDVFGMNSDYITLGIYGAYILGINKLPWIYSEGRRLSNSKSIAIDPLCFGMRLAMHIR